MYPHGQTHILCLVDSMCGSDQYITSLWPNFSRHFRYLGGNAFAASIHYFLQERLEMAAVDLYGNMDAVMDAMVVARQGRRTVSEHLNTSLCSMFAPHLFDSQCVHCPLQLVWCIPPTSQVQSPSSSSLSFLPRFLASLHFPSFLSMC